MSKKTIGTLVLGLLLVSFSTFASASDTGSVIPKNTGTQTNIKTQQTMDKKDLKGKDLEINDDSKKMINEIDKKDSKGKDLETNDDSKKKQKMHKVKKYKKGFIYKK